jgi:2-methylcitrate dehydratase PrpD
LIENLVAQPDVRHLLLIGAYRDNEVSSKLQFRTELEATGSLPYQMSCAVLDGRLGLGSLSAQSRSRSDVASFSQHVTHVVDQTLGKRFDGIVKIAMKTGDHLTREATLPNVDSARLVDKFIALVDGALSASRAREIAEALACGSSSWRDAVAVLQQIGLN